MTWTQKLTAMIPALAISSLTLGTLGMNAAAADDTPPPNSAPPADAPNGGRHHNPAWAACKKQADDQKIAPGDAHKDFMKKCISSAKSSAPAAS
jgi:psiF repeat-containing protein